MYTSKVEEGLLLRGGWALVPGATFYPSEHPFTAIDYPAFPARRLDPDSTLVSAQQWANSGSAGGPTSIADGGPSEV